MKITLGKFVALSFNSLHFQLILGILCGSRLMAHGPEGPARPSKAKQKQSKIHTKQRKAKQSRAVGPYHVPALSKDKAKAKQRAKQSKGKTKQSNETVTCASFKQRQSKSKAKAKAKQSKETNP